jgi:hypothetical protein
MSVSVGLSGDSPSLVALPQLSSTDRRLGLIHPQGQQSDGVGVSCITSARLPIS